MIDEASNYNEFLQIVLFSKCSLGCNYNPYCGWIESPQWMLILFAIKTDFGL